MIKSENNREHLFKPILNRSIYILQTTESLLLKNVFKHTCLLAKLPNFTNLPTQKFKLHDVYCNYWYNPLQKNDFYLKVRIIPPSAGPKTIAEFHAANTSDTPIA